MSHPPAAMPPPSPDTGPAYTNAAFHYVKGTTPGCTCEKCEAIRALKPPDRATPAAPESPTVEWTTFKADTGPGRIHITAPHVAALPDGILVNLPAGTTLRAGEDADAIGVSELHETASGAAQLQLGAVPIASEPARTPDTVVTIGRLRDARTRAMAAASSRHELGPAGRAPRV